MQKYRVEWSFDARDDLDLLWDWIVEESENPDVADAFVDKIIDYTEVTCAHPKNGTCVMAVHDKNIREIYFHGYTIVYEIIDSDCKVIIHEVYNQKRIYIRSYKR